VSHAIFFFILVYRVTNYSITVNFQIPQYNTTFEATGIDNTGTFYGSAYPCTGTCATAGDIINITTTEVVSIQETCSFQMLSTVSPAVPNAKVFDNYALSEAVSAKFTNSWCFNKYIVFIVLSNPADMLL
jgi:hypothetical protein